MGTINKINKLHSQIQTRKKTNSKEAIEIGKLLTVEKKSGKPNFRGWFETNINFKWKQGLIYMRIYRLSQNGLYNESESQQKNFQSDPKTKKSLKKLQKAEVLASNEKISYSTAREIVDFEEKTSGVYKGISKIPENKKLKIKFIILNGLEKAHELGRRGKILSMNAKLEIYSQVIEKLEK